MDKVEEEFEKLKKAGENDVDHLIQWMKDSKIIDGAKASEEKARALFKDVADQKKVELADFNEALTKVAAEHNKNLEEISKELLSTGQKVMGALGAAASAFKDAMKK